MWYFTIRAIWQYYFFEKLKIVGENLCKLNCSYGKVSHTLKFPKFQLDISFFVKPGGFAKKYRKCKYIETVLIWSCWNIKAFILQELNII